MKPVEQLSPEEIAFRQSANAWYKVTAAVPTFTAYDKVTGAKLVVDARTFDPQLHEVLDHEPPTAA
jgi:hypothetical protein